MLEYSSMIDGFTYICVYSGKWFVCTWWYIVIDLWAHYLLKERRVFSQQQPSEKVIPVYITQTV